MDKIIARGDDGKDILSIVSKLSLAGWRRGRSLICLLPRPLD
jgi:hypothetical protein